MWTFATLITRLCGLLIVAMWAITRLVKRDAIGSVVGRISWVMPTLVIVALLIPNIWMLFALLLLFLPIVAKDKADAAALYVVALVSLPTLTVYAKAGSAVLFAIDNYKVLSAGLLIAALIKPGPHGKISWLASVPVIVLFTLDTIALGRGQNFTSVLRSVLQASAQWPLPFIAMSLAVSRVEDVKRVVLSCIAAAGALSVVAAYQAKSFWPIYESITTHYGVDLSISQGTKIRGGLIRAGASFGESTSFGWFLAIVLLLTIQSRDRFRSPTHFIAMIGMIGLGLLLTQARGPWLGAAIGIVMLDIYYRRFAKAAIKMTAAATCYVGAVALAANLGMFSEVLSRRGGAQESIDYRSQLLTRGIQEIRANPIWGYDYTIVQSRLSDMRQGEGIIDFVNTYVYYGLVTGVIGAVMFGLVFVWSAWVASRQPLFGGETANVASPALFAGCGMTFVTAGTSGFSGTSTIFFIILLALGSVRLRGKPIGRAMARSGASATVRANPRWWSDNSMRHSDSASVDAQRWRCAGANPVTAESS